MEITISAHAAERAAERGITEEGIRAILGSASAVTIPSGSDPLAVIVVDMYAGKVWGVVFNFITKNVITVRRAWKAEVRQYEQKKKQ